MNKKRIAIVGAGDLGKQVAHFISQENKRQVVGFFDDFTNNEQFNGDQIIGKVQSIFSSYKNDVFDSLIIAIGYNHLKFKDNLYKSLKDRIPFETIVHPSVIIDPTSNIEEGCVIYPGCIIDQRVKICSNTLLNLGVIISHDSEIGTSNFLAPGVVVSGFCKSKERVFIGSNSTIRNNIIIGSDIKIGQGSNIIKNISQKGTYFGNSIRYYGTN